MNAKYFLLIVLLIHPFVSATGQDPEIQKVKVIAHRGGIVPGYPENTLSAFQRSTDLEVDYVELDLRATKDGEIVVIHDETLDRTTNGIGLVADYTLKELKKFDAGSGQSIPTLEEVLDLVSGSDVKLLFDIKLNKNLDAEQILERVRKFDMTSNIIIGVRSLEDLGKFHEINPKLRTLGFLNAVDQIDDFVKNGIDIIRLKPTWISENPSLISSIHNGNKGVWITVGYLSDAKLKAIVYTGVDGIIYDDPEKLQQVMMK